MFSDADKAETRDQPHTRIGAGWHPAPDAADDIRERVIRTIEAQRAPLEQLKAQIRSSQVDHEGEDALEWIEQRLSYLDGLQSIASSAPLPALLSLDLKMPAVAAASTSVLTAARTEAAHQIGHAIGEHTHEGYGHATHALEKRVRNTDAANNRHFQSAMGTLERHGLDGTFRRNQSELEAEREAAEKKGDHGKARVADALAGRNTLYALDRALELEEDPQKREQLEAERQRQIDVIAEREAAMRKQLHLDGLKAAQQDGLSGQEAENRAKEHVDRQLEIYRERDEKLYRDAGSPDASRNKETQEEIDRKRLMQEGKLDEHLLALRQQRKETQRLLNGTMAQHDAPTTASDARDVEAVADAQKSLRSLASSKIDQESFTETPERQTSSTALAAAAAQFHAQQDQPAATDVPKADPHQSEPASPAPTPSSAKPASSRERG